MSVDTETNGVDLVAEHNLELKNRDITEPARIREIMEDYLQGIARKIPERAAWAREARRRILTTSDDSVSSVRAQILAEIATTGDTDSELVN